MFTTLAADSSYSESNKRSRAVSRWNKLCNFVSCWMYIRIFLQCTDPWTL